MERTSYVIAMPQAHHRPSRVIKASTNALDAALELHRQFPRCDIYVAPQPPLAWRDGDMAETLIYWVNDDDELKAQHVRSW